jgi:hypothetical protein
MVQHRAVRYTCNRYHNTFDQAVDHKFMKGKQYF